MKNKFIKGRIFKINAIVAGVFSLCCTAKAQTGFTSGNVVVCQLGDSSTTTSGTAALVTLVEFNASGATGVKVQIPLTGTARLTESYSAGSEGQVTLSAERDRIIIPGYDAANTTASVASASGINRAVDAVTPSGAVVRAGYATQTTAYSGNNFRSATSSGNLYFGAGTSSTTSTAGVVSFGNGSATQIESAIVNARAVNVFNGQLYVSTATSPYYGIYAVGTSTIQGTSGQAVTSVINTGSSGSPYAFSFSADGNTCYIADTRNRSAGGGILKYVKSGGSFSTTATALATGVLNGATGVTADFSGTYPILYAVYTGDSLVRIVDSNNASNTSSFSLISIAPTRYHYRSVVASPSTSIWTGATNSDFATSTNWANGKVPSAFAEVIIPAVSNQPVVGANTAIAALTTLPSATISISSGDTLSVTNFLTDSGSVAGAGVLALTGTADQAIKGNGGLTNLMINDAVSSTITSGSSLNIKGILSLTNGALITNGGLTLVANGTVTARIPAITGGSLSGTINIQQYIPGKRAFRFLSHPYSSSIPLSQLTSGIDITGTGGSTNGFTSTQTNNPSAFWYNPLTGNGSTTNDTSGWIPFSSTNGSGSNAWNANEGIRVLVRGAAGQGLNGTAYTPGDVVLTTQGNINQGTVVQTLRKGSASAYNVLGNPYPSPTDIGTVIGNNSALLSGSGYWVWNPNMQTAGAYETKPVSGGAYYLPQNTAYVVATAADGNNLIYNEANKAAGATETLQKATVDNNYIALSIYDTASSLWDKLYIQASSQATDNEESFDAAKLSNTALDFYTLSADNQKLSIDSRPFTTGTIIPLGIATTAQQTYTLKADKVTVPNGMQLYLVDNYLNAYQPLQQGSAYNFTISADPASQGNSRFKLTVAQPTAINNLPDAGMSVSLYPNPAANTLNLHYINATQNSASVHIANLLGQVLLDKTVAISHTGDVSLDISSLPAGAYMVQYTSGDYTVTKKLIKQ